MKRAARLREVGLTAAEMGASGGEIVMVALLPVLLEPRVASAASIGALMAAEGAFAILVPYGIGALSDRLPTGLARRFGRRAFFLVVTAPLMAACLALIPFRDRVWAIALLLFAFFALLHAFLTPLFALVLERAEEERWGRISGVFGAMRAGGIAYGLVVGGLLFSAWPPLPFLVAAGLVLVTTALTYVASGAGRTEADDAGPERADGGGNEGLDRTDPIDEFDRGDLPGGVEGADLSRSRRGFWRTLAARPGARWFLVSNALGTAATDGIRPYIFLFAASVLGLSVARSSVLLLFLLVGVAAGSLATGWLGDRIGRGRLLLAGTVVTGIALAFGVTVRTLPAAILLMVPAGLGAATLATLPYPVFAEFAHAPTMGRDTGVFRISIGAARLTAPVVVGLAIDWADALFPGSDGYPIMWPVAAAFALLSAATLWRADRVAGGRIL